VNETLRTIDGRSVLRIERRLSHPPAKVWRAATEPAQLSRWFPAAVSYDGELAVGVKVGFDDGRGDGSSWDGVVTELDPPHGFGFTWEDDHIHIELSTEGDGCCLLVLTHTFGDRAGAASFASGWERCLDALDQLVDGQTPEIVPPSDELHEDYVRRFHLTDGVVEDRADGWTVRFERQLTRPAPTVWRVLTGAAPGGGDTPGPAVGGTVPQQARAAGVTPGVMTAVEAPTLLEYAWKDGDREGGRVRWELGHEGTGHGARLVVLQTGPSDLTEARSAALAAWAAPIDALATRLLATEP
jgi:uncharacterized protein YndB with AHSA1/START domain